MSFPFKLNFIGIDREIQSQSSAPSRSRFFYILVCTEGIHKLCHSGHTHVPVPNNTVDSKNIVNPFLRTEVACGTGTTPWLLLAKTCEWVSPPSFQLSVWSCRSAFSSKTIFKQLCSVARVRKRGSIFQQQRASDFCHSAFHCKGFRRERTHILSTQDFGVTHAMPFLTRMGLWEPESICFPLHLQILQDGF